LDLNQITIDRTGTVSLAEQVYDAIESRIAGGILGENSRLPTTRELAAALGVNRGTVQTAYRRLQERGLVEGRVGSGNVVRRHSPAVSQFRLAGMLSRRASELQVEQSDPSMQHFPEEPSEPAHPRARRSGRGPKPTR